MIVPQSADDFSTPCTCGACQPDSDELVDLRHVASPPARVRAALAAGVDGALRRRLLREIDHMVALANDTAKVAHLRDSSRHTRAAIALAVAVSQVHTAAEALAEVQR